MLTRSKSPSTQGKVILLAVRDSAILSSWLRAASHEVVIAETEVRLLRLALELRPSICIVDEELGGEQTLDLAVQMHTETDIPFLWLAKAPGCAGKAAELGAASYLVKPVAQDQLLASIDSATIRSAELALLRETSGRLKSALHAGRDISVATGVFMERYHMGQDQAFEALRRYSRTHNRRIADVAAEVIRAQELLNTTLPLSDQAKATRVRKNQLP